MGKLKFPLDPKSVMYGIFDDSYISFRERSAETEFATLAEALEEVAVDILDGTSTQYSIYPCIYIEKREGWFPVPGASGLTVDARGFTPISRFTGEEECDY